MRFFLSSSLCTEYKWLIDKPAGSYYSSIFTFFLPQQLRKQLCHLKTYLFTCKQSIADEFRKSMWPKEYLYEGVHNYTLAVSQTYINKHIFYFQIWLRNIISGLWWHSANNIAMIIFASELGNDPWCFSFHD